MFERVKRIFRHESKQVKPEFLGKNILTIDDDLSQRTMIQRTLEKSGLKVLTAEDGHLGIEIAQSQKPDLILLDVIMPGLNGNEVCRRLKSDNRTKDIPVVFLTSMDTPKEVIEHYDAGGEIHLTKPINPKELISQIEFTLGQK